MMLGQGSEGCHRLRCHSSKKPGRVLMQKLNERFDMGDVTAVIHHKIVLFNTLSIGPTEEPDEFVHRILRAKIELNGLGCDYIDEERHCLERLKGGLVHDNRFKEFAFTLETAVDMMLGQGSEGCHRSSVPQYDLEGRWLDVNP